MSRESGKLQSAVGLLRSFFNYWHLINIFIDINQPPLLLAILMIKNELLNNPESPWNDWKTILLNHSQNKAVGITTIIIITYFFNC